MPSSFPTNPDTFTTKVDGVDTVQAADVNNLQDAVLAVENFLLTPSQWGMWQSWTPSVYTGWSALPTGTYYYCVIGNLLVFNIDMTDGTSNGTNAVISLPLTVKNNTVFSGACGLAYDNGVLLTNACRWYVDNANSRVQFQKDMGTGAWTASGTKRVRCIGFAEV